MAGHKSNTSELNELVELLNHLKIRGIWDELRTFLKGQSISLGIGWQGMQQGIEQAAASADWPVRAEKLKSFLRDVALLSQKRIYVLSSDKVTPEKLGADLPRDERRDFFAGKAPTRPDSHPSYYLETRKVGRVEIHTFVTSRIVRRTEAVDKQSLSENGRVRYSNADLVAKYRMFFRCYDHILIHDKKAYLLLDTPEGVEGDYIRQDEANYHTRLMEQCFGPKHVEPVFTDLFPAIKSIYDDDKEGHVVYLEFISNHKAQVKGSCAKNAKNDWRKHPYHSAGEANAEMNPYKLGVKFVDHATTPIILLPGQATMIHSSTEVKRPPLNYMFLAEYTPWDGFAFALDRVLSHVRKQLRVANSSAKAKETHAT